MGIGKYFKDKSPELIVMILIIGGFSWLFPKVQSIEIEQTKMKQQVDNTKERLNRIANASEHYGLRIAENEMKRPVEMAAFIMSLKKYSKKDNFATMILSLRDNKHLILQCPDYNTASIGYAIARNHIEGENDNYTPKLSHLVDITKRQGLDLIINSSIDKQKAIISRLTKNNILNKIEKDWRIIKLKSNVISLDIKNSNKEHIDLNDFCLSLSDEKVLEIYNIIKNQ